MGLLDFFVERSPDPVAQPEQPANVPHVPYVAEDVHQQPSVAVVSGDSSNVIADVYSRKGLGEDGIFKMEQLMAALPSSTPTATAQTSIKMTLNVIGMNINDIIIDGTSRIEALNTELNMQTINCKTLVDETNQDIEMMKVAIENAQKKIAEAELTLENNKNSIEAEVKRLENLIGFAEGVSKLN